MSFLKAVVAPWLQPLPLGLLLACFGVFARRATGWRRLGIGLITAGIVLAVAATLAPVANALLCPLESRYPAVLDATALWPVPRYVAVLGSGYHPQGGLPVTAALDAAAVVRLTEGIRLFRQLPEARLILCGGTVHGWPPIARGYGLAAAALGVPQSALLVLDTPRDTGEEIRAIYGLVGAAPVLLVTSAAHMPRVMALARREGLHAVAAPTGNLTGTSMPGDVWLPLPSGTSLRKSETAFHEYLGLLALEFGVT